MPILQSASQDLFLSFFFYSGYSGFIPANGIYERKSQTLAMYKVTISVTKLKSKTFARHKVAMSVTKLMVVTMTELNRV